MLKLIHNLRLWIASIITPANNIVTKTQTSTYTPIYELGKVDPIDCTSFSGTDMKVYLTDHKPYDLKEIIAGKPLGSIQAVTWVFREHKRAEGSIIRTILDSAEPLGVKDKWLTVVSANEYGNYAVLACFYIEGITSRSVGVSVDDIIVEEHIAWRGTYRDEVLKIHGKGTLSREGDHWKT